MLFLMNDVVLRIDPQAVGLPLDAASLDRLNFSWILRHGAEMFAEEPDLPRVNPARAHRLAVLIAAKRIEVNAARFEAPSKGCMPEAVRIRVATLGFETMAGLAALERRGVLDEAAVDRGVWRRAA